MTSERKSMRLVGWKAIRKGGLLGFVTLTLPNGLTLIDCPLCRAVNGRLFASLPAKSVLDEHGQHARPGGKPQYTPIARWPSREINTAWSDRVVALVRQAHPGALE
jgi:hypothetical protein